MDLSHCLTHLIIADAIPFVKSNTLGAGGCCAIVGRNQLIVGSMDGEQRK